MKIDIKKKTNVVFSHLDIEYVFDYNNDAYIKIKSFDRNGINQNAFDILNNQTCNFSGHEDIIPAPNAILILFPEDK